MNLWIKDRLKEWMNKWIFNELINELNLGSGERSTWTNSDSTAYRWSFKDGCSFRAKEYSQV